LYRKCGNLNISQPYRPPRPVTGIALPFLPYLNSVTDENKSQAVCRIRGSHSHGYLATFFTLVSCLAYSSALKREATCSLKLLLLFNRLHGIIAQKIELFKSQAER
jgi:hypothetical protein